MPVVFIEAPPGIRIEAKKTMVERITAAIDDAYHIGDTLIFLREYPAEKRRHGRNAAVGESEDSGSTQENIRLKRASSAQHCRKLSVDRRPDLSQNGAPTGCGWREEEMGNP